MDKALQIMLIIQILNKADKAGADNVNNINSINITFTVKDKKIYVPVVTLSARGNRDLSTLLRKGF